MANRIKNYIKDRKLSKKNALELVPSRLVEHSATDEGKVCLHVKRFKYSFISKLFNKSDFFTVKLDDLGSRAWLLIDEKRNIEQIASSMAENVYNTDEMQVRVVAFLTNLYRKDLITFSI